MNLLGKILLTITLLSTSLLAESGQLFLKMKDMRDAMQQISDGFFSNNVVSILDGISKLEQANAIFNSYSNVKKHLHENEQHMAAVAYNNALKLKSNLIRIREDIERDQFNDASMVYTKIIGNCTSCHAIIRGW